MCFSCRNRWINFVSTVSAMCGDVYGLCDDIHCAFCPKKKDFLLFELQIPAFCRNTIGCGARESGIWFQRAKFLEKSCDYVVNDGWTVADGFSIKSYANLRRNHRAVSCLMIMILNFVWTKTLINEKQQKKIPKMRGEKRTREQEREH